MAGAGLAPAAAALLGATWQARASNAFNLGGLLGAFAAVPLARGLGRRPMFMAYFLFSALALLLTVVADIDSGFDLFWNDCLQGGKAGCLDFARLDYLPACAPGI